VTGLAIRLAAVIKIRELIEKWQQEEIEISDVEEFVMQAYFRSKKVFMNNPLYAIKPLAMIGRSYYFLKVVEMKALLKLTDALQPGHGHYTQWEKKCPHLYEMMSYKLNKTPNLPLKILHKENTTKCDFPCALRV